MDCKLDIYRRRLPHWIMGGSTYFLTWRLAKAAGNLSEAEREIVANAIKHFMNQRYQLLGYVVMDDHVHLILLPTEPHSLSSIVHSIKSYTATMINKQRGKTGSLWQDERYDRLIRDEGELIQKLEYILTNPERRWSGIKDYKWVEWFPLEKP